MGTRNQRGFGLAGEQTWEGFGSDRESFLRDFGPDGESESDGLRLRSET
jgi:hypothetical protein